MEIEAMRLNSVLIGILSVMANASGRRRTSGGATARARAERQAFPAEGAPSGNVSFGLWPLIR